MTTKNSDLTVKYNLIHPPIRKHGVNRGFDEKKNNFKMLYSQILTTTDPAVFDDFIVSGRNLSNEYLKIYQNTSDINALTRFLEIHDAIAQYYPDEATDESYYFIRDKCKYFANHIRALFLLNRLTDVRKQLIEFQNHYERHKKYVKVEFRELIKHISLLYASACLISVFNDNREMVNIHYRIGRHRYELIDHFDRNASKLKRAVIIGSCATQVSYCGYSIDTLRISQAIECEPTERTEMNPRKWMFYNASIYEVELGINDATHKMSKDIFLFYADGDEYKSIISTQKPVNDLTINGLKMKQFSDDTIEHPKDECLLPLDLISYIVCPTIVIIDSNASHHFFTIKDHTKLPILCLLSPMLYPNFIETRDTGKLFTLFLSSPLQAFSWICEKYTLTQHKWLQIEHLLNEFMQILCHEMIGHVIKNQNLQLFWNDKVSRVLLMRYMFCIVALRSHNDFPVNGYLPKCNFVELESDVVYNKYLQDIIYEMAGVLDSLGHFAFSSIFYCLQQPKKLNNL